MFWLDRKFLWDKPLLEYSWKLEFIHGKCRSSLFTDTNLWHLDNRVTSVVWPKYSTPRPPILGTWWVTMWGLRCTSVNTTTLFSRSLVIDRGMKTVPLFSIVVVQLVPPGYDVVVRWNYPKSTRTVKDTKSNLNGRNFDSGLAFDINTFGCNK